MRQLLTRKEIECRNAFRYLVQILSSGVSTIQATLCTLARLVLIMEMLRDVERGKNMIVAELLLLPARQEARDLEDILDLATVHVHASELIQLYLRDRVILRGRVQEVVPDSLARVDRQLLVVERDMDARLERGIERLNTVGGQEHCT
jgi:hypothetical protein